MSMPTKPRCGDCRFFDWLFDDYGIDFGSCHRFPPVFVAGEGHSGQPEGWSTPTVSALHWCGEFKPAEGEK
jgi:hypothetical protein